MDKKQTSLRLRSEFNDLKRTPESIAREINFSKDHIDSIFNGNFSYEVFFKFISKAIDFYPINLSDIIIEKKDTKNGILFFKNSLSKKSARIFKREDRNGELSDYYEYRDTAKSNQCFFYPEWISQIRVVKDSDPQNPDVVYNHGHFLHQINLFVGPVNFYYEINGRKYCEEMNTGDSSYISPYIRHSFTSRDEKKLAYIVAVTTGSNFKRNQKEIRKFGKKFIEEQIVPIKSSLKFFKNVVSEAIRNELLTDSDINKLNSVFKNKLKNEAEFANVTVDELKKASNFLKIPVSELLIDNDEDPYVINKHKNDNDFHFYPSKTKRYYKIFRLAFSAKYKKLKAFVVEVNNKITQNNFKFSSNLYLINFGSNSCVITWTFSGKQFSKTINPNDSLYIEPYISFGFKNKDKNSFLYLVTSETCSSNELKREISSIKNAERIISDNSQWFKGK